MTSILIYLLKLLSRLPLSFLYIISDFLCLIMKIIGYRKDVIIKNLTNSFPEKSIEDIYKIKNDFYLNLSDILIESLKGITISKEETNKRIKFVNPELYQDSLDNNVSFISMASHLCNWEWQLLKSSAYGFPVVAVYQQLSNPIVDKLMLEIRSKFGAKLVESKQLLRYAIKTKNERYGIALPGDQTPQKNKIDFWTDFLNQETPFFTGGQKMAQLLGHDVYYMEMKRIKRGFYELRMQLIAKGPHDKNSDFITQTYSEMLAKSIEENPANWLWSHKRWKHKRD